MGRGSQIISLRYYNAEDKKVLGVLILKNFNLFHHPLLSIKKHPDYGVFFVGEGGNRRRC